MSESVAKTEYKPSVEVDAEKIKHAKTMTMVIYGLQAVSFIFGITFIIAVIVNYVKKEEVGGTWLSSHFRWQIRTFWFSVLWTIIGAVTVFLGVGYFILLANAIWVIYRIVKGWLALVDSYSRMMNVDDRWY